jgi:hypothetical protein
MKHIKWGLRLHMNMNIVVISGEQVEIAGSNAYTLLVMPLTTSNKIREHLHDKNWRARGCVDVDHDDYVVYGPVEDVTVHQSRIEIERKRSIKANRTQIEKEIRAYRPILSDADEVRHGYPWLNEFHDSEMANLHTVDWALLDKFNDFEIMYEEGQEEEEGEEGGDEEDSTYSYENERLIAYLRARDSQPYEFKIRN